MPNGDLMSVDPGKRHTAVAVFDLNSRELICAEIIKARRFPEDDLEACELMVRAVAEWHAMHSRRPAYPVELVVERPQVYTAGKQHKGGRWTDPNDLPPLFGVDVGLAVHFSPLRMRSYFPHEWKGTMTKEAMGARVLTRLSPGERGNVASRMLADHNVLDAIGIGLHHLGRLERARVYPGAT